LPARSRAGGGVRPSVFGMLVNKYAAGIHDGTGGSVFLRLLKHYTCELDIAHPAGIAGKNLLLLQS